MPSKIDLLNRISILAFEALDHIIDASVYGLLQLRLEAERRFGGEGVQRPAPGCLSAIAVRDGVVENAVDHATVLSAFRISPPCSIALT